ncbi:hypothetical protein A3C98_03650 [Candidatus Roizmanbacteria bacterium RIFCSPHIGHO2_02_FULL_37_15]|uniref:Protease HtpX homolog n=1 Tax=Candidatus Roizmanbacteria bacterium RIFCSPLOWO2_01_FULL_37_16 TaxID=1802058 RepID=A0A1F7IP46_9BACT|nr:MAG: hypothetical protein A2859_05080 [Candidatus Roizmanbacteria bacterium RIFCSPHIGHO2_01_FULL_37_16b]OGK20463.1 MAG: hypothetical protein A3C98_03650 [Candidatus Roizmanbacteria bacterium RIFCSPHIGHO2_02_FULL_37_15]OGK31730.1 MAG: hypothetical protein A3F57_00060 [Candidatus Roizmanbacteria bacterium RIFCSPHIGHO2_12_FULL_36_11]OGK45101.1 MAG: hypothetical protein A3B40_05715 [Candidatus Roizmanbacteria bacterium RIFCSPLOWO2_01_FULL_37_16]OGK55818.1 MAG: hypothetical protein A3I50_03290 [C
MTVYDQIKNNKLRTYTIIFTFILLVSGFFYLIGKFVQSPTTYFFIGLTLSLASTVGSYLYSDRIVLFTSGAKPALKKDYFDFYTVTENLAVAAGLPMPKLYVINDPALNAYATGRDPKHAVVCATTGLLTKLERTELEGVIGHELSHVKNYDILVSSLVAVLVGTIVLVSDWIMRNLWWSRSAGWARDDDRGSRNPFMAVFLIFVLIITPIAATLIQLAVSRKREFLADASGALLTRYPEGLARALEKIAEDKTLLQRTTASTAHLYIINPFKKMARTNSWFMNLFSTHPPVSERIKILRSI